ncbi:MAG: hypothetical protein QM775_19025 [Pirellulales bacterium]
MTDRMESTPAETALSAAASQTDTEVTVASQPFIGRWGRLVSQTNWEKGRIIAEWRKALVSAGVAPHEYADEAWSRLVGQVTPQHVGRLRRTYVRFHGQQTSFDGLYWSHFLAALEWNDAELWLEGAVLNGWSISEMRAKRWETLGSPVGEEPREADVVAADVDEDAGPTVEGSAAEMAEIRARENSARPASSTVRGTKVRTLATSPTPPPKKLPRASTSTCRSKARRRNVRSRGCRSFRSIFARRWNLSSWPFCIIR